MNLRYYGFMDLKDFLKLAGQQGKVVVMGEDGEVKGLFLPIDEYQKLSEGKSVEKKLEDITEKVNREILQAQLEEVISPADVALGLASSALPAIEPTEFATNAERIDSLLTRRAQNLFKAMPYDYRTPEVTSTPSDEEIKPNFDDI